MKRLHTSHCVEKVQLSSFPKNYMDFRVLSRLYINQSEVKSTVNFLFLFVFTENDKKETMKL